MLSKCANPECSEILRYLHQGKIFCLAPTPDVQVAMGMQHPALEERFWLCDRCSREMTVTWDGTQATVKPLPAKIEIVASPHLAKSELRRTRPRARAAHADRNDR